jgi:hypothetical protein
MPSVSDLEKVSFYFFLLSQILMLFTSEETARNVVCKILRVHFHPCVIAKILSGKKNMAKPHFFDSLGKS